MSTQYQPNGIFEVRKTVTYTTEQLEGILVGCFEGGSNYWIDSVEIGDKPKAKYEWLSDIVPLGGTLWITDDEGNRHYLTINKLLTGLRKYRNSDFDDWDSLDYDNILQLALFGEIVYG
jgi:hypothetical protein